MIQNRPRIKISELCTLIVDCVNKTAPSEDNVTPYRMLRTPNIKRGKINLDSCRFVSQETFKKWTRRANVQKGDVLLTREAPMGETGIVTYDDPNTFLGQRIMQYRADPKKLDPQFLLYSFLSPDLQFQFGRHGNSGSIVSHIRVPDCFEFEISLPDLEEQKRISNILANLDSKIEINNKINTDLKAMAKTLYDYWFVQFDFPDTKSKPYKSSGGKMVFSEVLKREIPEYWEVNSFSSWIKNDKSGDWGKETEQGNYVKKVSCIRGADLNDLNGKGVVKSPTRYVLEKNCHKLLEIGDFIIEISGGSPTQSTGRMAFITKETLERFENPLICSNFCKAVRLKDEKSLYNFAYEWNRLYDAGVLFGWEGKTSGIKNLLFEPFVTNYKVAKPPKKLIELFYKKVKPIHAQIQKNLQQNQKLEELRDWLLPMLMNGQVTVGEVKKEVDIEIEMQEDLIMFNPKPLHMYSSVIGTHITKELVDSPNMGRTKLQKVLHLVEYKTETELGGFYKRNVAGPHNDILIRHIEGKFRQFGHIKVTRDIVNGYNHFTYRVTSRTTESENAYLQIPNTLKTKIDSLVELLKPLSLLQTEAISTLYAVWNNRLIKNQEINNQLLLIDFYNWSKRKREKFEDPDVIKALDFMNTHDIIPKGWGMVIQ